MQKTKRRTIAVLDLGTNTFRILLAQPHGKYLFKALHEEKVYVRLAKTGIDYIGEAAYRRALDAMERFEKIINKQNVSEVYAFATEGMRRASNSEQLIAEVKDRYGISIRRISGDMEATFIYHGVQQVFDLGTRPHLLMDIGGGSTEFIIANATQIFWKQSFAIGGTVLKQQFHQQEPLSPQDVTTLTNYLEQVLQPFWKAAKKYAPINTLVGTSGTFSSINKMAAAAASLTLSPEQHIYPIQLTTANALAEHLLHTTLEERLSVPGLEPERAELISVAFILVQLVLQRLHISHLFYSSYAIKEGILWYVFKHPKLMEDEGLSFHTD
ncbi:hypothetical protein C7N43_00125 [Sphingobacteriales bacterium UPWRP_1]|nr:hypothetical protein BVG80_15055 [Sphingobacteriales bacterium TSM_CSM]PSJ79067.1 hypothetical protein C7N43_00125 [Sphingobacteriales bacterium UPWRP_1]